MVDQEPDKKTLGEETEELVIRFDKERNRVNAKMKELSGFMANTTKLADNKHEIYRYRQEVVALKLSLMTTSNIWNRRAIKARSEIYLAYKIGKKKIAPHASIAENYQLKPKNDFERKLYLDSDMRLLDSVVQMIENQLEFTKDSLSNVTNMCFGMEHVIKLEEHRSL